LQNRLDKIEREIQEQESAIKIAEKELAENDYSDAAKTDTMTKKYEGLKSKLDQLLAEWEEVSAQL
jgi:DNA-binding transcriptional regulator GbsR (MarR family)